MNHQKIYENIVSKAKSENRKKVRKNQKGYVYYENHHILPRCLGGDNEEGNLVLLTAREHFVCHKLLTYIYKGNIKIVYSLVRLIYDKNNRKISSKDYEYLKLLQSTTPMSKEQKEKLSKSHKGKITWMKGKHHKEETKKILSEKSKLLVGNKNPFFGKTHSEESKEKNRQAHLGKITSIETKEKLSKAGKGKIPWNKGLKLKSQS